MQEISRLLAQTSLPSADRLPSGCADCFIYDVEITSTTGIIRIHADDTSLTDSGAQPLIQFLGELRDRALRSAD